MCVTVLCKCAFPVAFELSRVSPVRKRLTIAPSPLKPGDPLPEPLYTKEVDTEGCGDWSCGGSAHSREILDAQLRGGGKGYRRRD